jgi:hypothetical protein
MLTELKMNKMAMNVSIFLLLGVAYMVTCNGCSGAGKYKKYSSADPELNITMDYISGWQYRETRGSNNSYADVFFGEPRNKGEEGIRKAFISVTSVNTPRGGKLETLADDFSNSRLKYKDGKLLKRARIKIPSGEAIELSFSYRALNKIYSIDSKLTPVEEKVVILINGGRSYTIRYENKEDDFNRFDKDFNRIIKSIRFKQKR